jgi:hypothetical protein
VNDEFQKDAEGSNLVYFKVYLGIILKGLRKTSRRRCPGRHSNSVPETLRLEKMKGPYQHNTIQGKAESSQNSRARNARTRREVVSVRRVGCM